MRSSTEAPGQGPPSSSRDDDLVVPAASNALAKEDASSSSVERSAATQHEPAIDTEAEEVEPTPGEAPAVVAASTQTVESHPIDFTEEEKEDMFSSKELMEELKDSKQFGQRGEAVLFAQLAVIALLLFPPFALKGLVDLVGTLCVTAGAVFASYALISLGRNFSPLPKPRKKHHLVVTGMYSYVRHPMYSGLILMAVGLAALTRNETRLALAAMLWWILEQKVAAEERLLRERYAEQYEEYAARVSKFFPFVY